MTTRLTDSARKKVDRIIQSLADGTYMPNPARREYIQKKQNSTKKRPLGIPTFTDKLVQEVLRMILESVYEPIFFQTTLTAFVPTGAATLR